MFGENKGRMNSSYEVAAFAPPSERADPKIEGSRELDVWKHACLGKSPGRLRHVHRIRAASYQVPRFRLPRLTRKSDAP